MPETILLRFANEARALNITRMHEIHEPKLFTLAVTLGRVRAAQALDDLAEMFIRLLDRLRVAMSISQGKVRVSTIPC
jgi:hypothetical protein